MVKGVLLVVCVCMDIFLILLEKKNKMGEKVLVHESRELLKSLCSETVHTNLIKLPGNIIIVTK